MRNQNPFVPSLAKRGPSLLANVERTGHPVDKLGANGVGFRLDGWG